MNAFPSWYWRDSVDVPIRPWKSSGGVEVSSSGGCLVTGFLEDVVPSLCLTRSTSHSDRVKSAEFEDMVLGWMLGHRFSWRMLRRHGV
jgi:hypothetical protein